MLFWNSLNIRVVKVEGIEENALEELQNNLKQVKLIREGKLPKQAAYFGG